MTTPAYQEIHFKDGNPPATAGFINGKWQKSAPYADTAIVNGITVPVTTIDVSVEVPQGASAIEAIGITVDGGGNVITTGSKGYFQTQFSGTILGVVLLADQSGSIVFDIRKGTYSAFPTNSSIVASDPPTLSSAQKSDDTTLTGWTTAFTDGDIFEYKVSSAGTVTRVVLILRVQRS